VLFGWYMGVLILLIFTMSSPREYGTLFNVLIVNIPCVLALGIPLWGSRKDFF
jgi:hypothetical protein